VHEFEDFVLFNVYFPNGKMSKERLNYKMDFYNRFLSYTQKLKNKGKKIVFCGDVNTAHKEIDLSRPKENQKVSGFLPMERQWIDSVIEKGFVDSLREFHTEGELYSWWDLKSRARDRNVGWRIDYVFVDNSLVSKLSNAYILTDVLGSDHAPVGVEFR
jgi:exodeoxyribonuclease-3